MFMLCNVWVTSKLMIGLGGSCNASKPDFDRTNHTRPGWASQLERMRRNSAKVLGFQVLGQFASGHLSTRFSA